MESFFDNVIDQTFVACLKPVRAIGGLGVAFFISGVRRTII
jgi:hypothetical protein